MDARHVRRHLARKKKQFMFALILWVFYKFMNSYIIAGRASVLDTIIELHNETYAAQNGDGGDSLIIVADVNEVLCRKTDTTVEEKVADVLTVIDEYKNKQEENRYESKDDEEVEEADKNEEEEDTSYARLTELIMMILLAFPVIFCDFFLPRWQPNVAN